VTLPIHSFGLLNIGEVDDRGKKDIDQLFRERLNQEVIQRVSFNIISHVFNDLLFFLFYFHRFKCLLRGHLKNINGALLLFLLNSLLFLDFLKLNLFNINAKKVKKTFFDLISKERLAQTDKSKKKT
jgi:hypothetical protein